MKTNLIFFWQNREAATRGASIAGLGLLLLIVILAAWSGNRYQHSSKWRIHSDEVLNEIQGLRIAIEMAESVQRGYVITQQEKYVSLFRQAATDVENRIPKLLGVIADNPLQTERAREVVVLVQQKLQVLREVMQLAESGKVPAAIAHIRGGQGQELMEKSRFGLDSLASEESILLQNRAKQADQDFRRTGLTVLFGLILSFVLLVTATGFLRNEIGLRQKTQEDLERANITATEASNMKSNFLANMSHEIRTPLNGIIGMSRLLEQTSLSEKQKDFVDTIKISSNALLALINEILDISKIESGKLQLEDAHFEMESLLKSTMSIVEFSAQSKGLKLSLDLPSNIPHYFVGDPLRLRQVLLNLLNNSIKFSEQGTVLLKVSKISEVESKVRVLFEIVDQGIGLDAETRSRLFRAFSQGDESTSRKYGGTGLGLAIAKQIVDMMGGKIDVESVKGIGSRFFFEIALKPAKYEEMAQPVTLDSMAGKKLKGRVLVAEDNRTNQKVVAEMIGLLGCEIVVVNNGKECIETLLKDENFDLVLMDGQMPVIDGYEACEKIRRGEAGASHQKIPVIATTANAIKGDVERCFEAGMNDYLGKPISYDDLTIKVEKWLRRGKNIVDMSALENIRKLSEKSKKNIMKELVQVFEEDTRSMLLQMKSAIEMQQDREIAQYAHTLKSSSANMGILRMRDLCHWLEKAAKDSTAKQMQIVVDAIEREFNDSLPLLKIEAERT